jgi:hypothetical protein
MPLNGLVTMTPTSIVSTGTGNSSSINTNGSVTFDTCAALSLNGVFTSDYDNYQIVIRHKNASNNEYIKLRWRASGTDATGSNYVYQSINPVSSTITGTRFTAQTSHGAFSTSSTLRSGSVGFVFGPYLSQATAMRSLSMYAATNASLEDVAGTHSLSTSYDGFTLFVGASISGLVTVYGFNQ